MVILHIGPIDMTRANGFRFSVPGLVSAQNNIKGISAALMNVGNSKNLLKEEVENFDFIFFDSLKEIGRLPLPFNSPDIVVFHGVYLYEYIKIYKQLIKLNIPYVIVPRVSLTEGAQRQKFFKKKIGNFALFNKFINNSSRIHYLTENEKRQSSSFQKECFVAGNGMKLPVLVERSVTDHINITFIGRYDLNHKGLDILVDSLVSIKSDLIKKNVKIRLFGSDFRGGKEYIKNQIEKHNLENILIVNDAVYGDDKHSILLETDIFITTSRFEGHPMAVIEAMAYGIPCILTEGTNLLDKLVLYDAGWSTTLDKTEIESTILLSIEDKCNFIKKGINARRLVEENYTWDKVAYKTVRNYRNIINFRRTIND